MLDIPQTTSGPAHISSERNALTDLIGEIGRAAGGLMLWLGEVNKALLFGEDNLNHPLNLDECGICHLIDSVEDPEVRSTPVFMKLAATHNAVHEASERVLDQKKNGLLGPGEYEIFTRSVARLSRYIVQLRNLGFYSVAQTDTLTGLLNREAMQNSLTAEIERCKRSGKAFSVSIVDIDHFKSINDTYGHPAGDEILVQLSERFEDLIRPYDSVFRYGGEEFLFMLPETESADALEVMERIRHAIQKEPFPTDAGEISISISAGLVDSLEASDEETLVSIADNRLYQAKEGGRNQIIGAALRQ